MSLSLDDRIKNISTAVLLLHGKHNQKKHGVRRAANGQVWFDSMTDEGKASLREWTEDSKAMRGIIAGDEGMRDAFPRKAKLTDDFVDALKTSPLYDGTAHRGLRFNTKDERDDFVKSISNGMKEGSVSSFSKVEGTAREFTGRAEISLMLRVKMKTGNDITRFNRSEEEVVNRRGASYRTVKVTPGMSAWDVKTENIKNHGKKIGLRMPDSPRPPVIEMEEL
jgi:hypothetical protein